MQIQIRNTSVGINEVNFNYVLRFSGSGEETKHQTILVNGYYCVNDGGREFNYLKLDDVHTNRHNESNDINKCLATPLNEEQIAEIEESIIERLNIEVCVEDQEFSLTI